jgi:hypothetical protein
VVRSIEANPASQLVAVSLLDGEERRLADVAVRRIRGVEVFEGEKRRLGVPDDAAKAEWFLHVTSGEGERLTIDAIVHTFAQALGAPTGCKEVKEFQKEMRIAFSVEKDSREETHSPQSIVYH